MSYAKELFMCDTQKKFTRACIGLIREGWTIQEYSHFKDNEKPHNSGFWASFTKGEHELYIEMGSAGKTLPDLERRR